MPLALLLRAVPARDVLRMLRRTERCSGQRLGRAAGIVSNTSQCPSPCSAALSLPGMCCACCSAQECIQDRLQISGAETAQPRAARRPSPAVLSLPGSARILCAQKGI